eukprot:TRINITY_DN1608_c0_g2_i9.p2 TRINITY_DN1608_c0_g2~~TRINITY_DN1608_c0_g2_i9.p2  ORF type:complete len:331 (+),score=105.94 TRINITY_DN1608_c0_g2_i9:263-1255(+)
MAPKKLPASDKRKRQDLYEEILALQAQLNAQQSVTAQQSVNAQAAASDGDADPPAPTPDPPKKKQKTDAEGDAAAAAVFRLMPKLDPIAARAIHAEYTDQYPTLLHDLPADLRAQLEGADSEHKAFAVLEEALTRLADDDDADGAEHGVGDPVDDEEVVAKAWLLPGDWPRRPSEIWWLGFGRALTKLYPLKGNQGLQGKRDKVVEKLRGLTPLRPKRADVGTDAAWVRKAAIELQELELVQAEYDSPGNPVLARVEMGKALARTMFDATTVARRKQVLHEVRTQAKTANPAPKKGQEQGAGDGEKKERCRMFALGKCKRGGKCRYSHAQ